MQTTGVGVLAQWKRVVTSLGTASDLSLDFTFFPHDLLCARFASAYASRIAEKWFITTY